MTDLTQTTGAGAPRPVAVRTRQEVEGVLHELRKLGGGASAVLREARLIDQDLSGLDLSGVDLRGADLSRANLSGARLVGADLREAVLFEADLSGCELLSADLSGADLSECRGEGTGFGAATLNGARFFNSRLRGATFTQSALRGADLRAADLRQARMREADLREADLSRSDLRGVDIESSRLAGAVFIDADLREARIRGATGYDQANWIGADIQNVDFCGAYLIRRTIMDQNYLHEFRTRSRFNAALYWTWWASSDCGRSFLRWGLWTIFLGSVFAGLYELVEIDYGEHPTFLSPVYYSVVTLTTLGYGDVLPASPAAQLLCMVEVVLGYVMLGGLLSIFSNKMARRAD